MVEPGHRLAILEGHPAASRTAAERPNATSVGARPPPSSEGVDGLTLGNHHNVFAYRDATVTYGTRIPPTCRHRLTAVADRLGIRLFCVTDR